MRIISHFKDCYDGVQRQGIDKTCTWVRNCWETYHKESYGTCLSTTKTMNLMWYNRIAVGFCGEVMHAVIIDGKVYYDWDEIEFFIRSSNLHKNRQGRPYFNFAAHKEEFYNPSPRLNEWFVKYNTPVFIVTPYNHRHSHSYIHTTSQPFENSVKIDYGLETLNTVEFYRHTPIYQIFQSIHQYLSGVLGMGQPYVPDISDKDMRDIKGFNEWSFKTPPTKK